MLKLWEVTTHAVIYDLSIAPSLHISVELSVLHPEATRGRHQDHKAFLFSPFIFLSSHLCMSRK